MYSQTCKVPVSEWVPASQPYTAESRQHDARALLLLRVPRRRRAHGLVPGRARGWRAPSYGGLNVVWQDGFTGPGGSSPDGSNWNMVTGNLGVNGELETYSSSTANVQISGGGTVQLVPWRDGSTSGGWTSGRIESTFTFTPGAGRLTVAEAQIRFGDNQPSAKKGLWPAFWLLGDAIRHGTGWPRCGEIDVLETVNGQMTGYGTVHCDSSPGGRCNEPSGLSGSTGFSPISRGTLGASSGTAPRATGPPSPSPSPRRQPVRLCIGLPRRRSGSLVHPRPLAPLLHLQRRCGRQLGASIFPLPLPIGPSISFSLGLRLTQDIV